MRAMAPPSSRRRPVRRAAVQPATDGPSSLVLKRGAAKVGAADAKWLATYNDWQGWARRYARELSVVQFSTELPAAVASRCEFFVEERDPAGNWNRSEDVRLADVMEMYRNPRQASRELVRMHFRHYNVAGECVQVITDGPGGVEWWLFSTAALEWDKPERGLVTVKLLPNGRVDDETAFVVPRDQVVRFWRPDDEWQSMAVSPMVGIIEDLHRYRAMANYAKSTAESAAAMGGMLWTPAEAHLSDGTDADADVDDAQQQNPGQPSSELERAYYELARRRFDPNDNDITAIVPPMVKWDNELKAPQWVKLVDALDPNGIAYRKEALEDIARGLPVPSSIVLSGGPGDANHWTEWLVDRKFFDNAIADTLDQVCHADLTATFLVPVLLANGLTLGRHRIGYDPTPVIVKQDKSVQALQMYLAGLLKGEKALEESGYDPDDRMTAEELRLVIDVLSRSLQYSGGGAGLQVTTPVGPSNTIEEPPAAPQQLAAAVKPQQLALPVVGASQPAPNGNGAAPTPRPPSPAKTNRLLGRLARIRANVGRELLAAAEQAFAEALTRAGTKVLARSKSRASKTLDATVVAAVRAGDPLRPYIAAIGLREDELLRDQFATFQSLAEERLRRAQAQQRKAIEAAGYDPDEFLAQDTPSSAAEFLSGALLALAYNRLMEGPSTPSVIVDGIPSGPGEVTGNIPARVVTQTLAIAEGAATGTAGATPSQAPVFQQLADRRSIERALADRALSALREARADNLERALERGRAPERIEAPAEPEPTTLYVWRWGFYGDPTTPFEPHQDLGASEFTTTDPTGDPALSNPLPWPDGALYQPGDHDGCTCEWEIIVGDESQVQLRIDAPELV